MTLTIRTLAGADPAHYLAYGPSSVADVGDRFQRHLDAGHFRPEWLWLAERDGRVVARAAFWGRPDADAPSALDHFDIRPDDADPIEAGAALLEAAYDATTRPDGSAVDFHQFLPPRWRDHPDAEHVRRHVAAAERAGLVVLVERHRWEWTPDRLLAATGDRLAFRPVRDDDDGMLVDLLARVVNGSLDVGTTRTALEVGPAEAARRYLADMDALDATRGHWVLGDDTAGVAAGVAIAAALSDNALVGFVGVPPEQRGRGYGLDLLVEVTRRLVAGGAGLLRADTDVTNSPMVRIFDRAGWRIWGTRLVMTRPASADQSLRPGDARLG